MTALDPLCFRLRYHPIGYDRLFFFFIISRSFRELMIVAGKLCISRSFRQLMSTAEPTNPSGRTHISTAHHSGFLVSLHPPPTSLRLHCPLSYLQPDVHLPPHHQYISHNEQTIIRKFVRLRMSLSGLGFELPNELSPQARYSSSGYPWQGVPKATNGGSLKWNHSIP